MRHLFTLIAASTLLFACSGNQKGSAGDAEREDKESKRLLQGVWVTDEDGDVSFRVEGDTIYYPDSTVVPAYFRIVGDSLQVGAAHYPIEKLSSRLFWFHNQTGDLVKLQKSEDPTDTIAFVHDEPQIITYTHQVKLDSIVYYEGTRYHWYIAINPTKYKVSRRSYNSEGMEVENIYYDNIMHVSVFKVGAQLFSRDFRKQMYETLVPATFLEAAILTDMQYSSADQKGIHFNATLCIPEEASCYIVENIVGYDGKLSTTLLEY